MNAASALVRRTVVADSGCLLWAGRLDLNGYGRLGNSWAHRRVYESLVGPIPAGLTLDHLCRVPPCVNPFHLEPVTRGENVRRAFAAQTHCRRGHELSREGHVQIGKQRFCGACYRNRVKREGERQKAFRRANPPPVQTHCIHGHPFDEANTYYRRDNGCRMCRACTNERTRRYNKAAAARRSLGQF